MVGAILAGGAGSRMGGGKPRRELAGRPLAAYPAAALAAVCDRVAVVCKPGTELPAGIGWVVWDDEPAEPRHPATGIAHALRRARARVLVCAADMPFVGERECRAILESDRDGRAAACVAVGAGGLEPAFALYAPAAAAPLAAAAARGEPLRLAVEALGPVRVELEPAALRSVDTPADLAEAELLLRGGR